MRVKVFVLGLPGSGKSLTSRLFMDILKREGWITRRFKDYDILLEMFRNASNQGKFRPTKHDGFDVLDLRMFDLALQEVVGRITDYISIPCAQNELILIEFARDDYRKALEQFSHELLEDSYFIFIDADIPTCISRIQKRVAHPQTLDDHFVSEYIFDAYYQKDTKQYFASSLEGIACVDVQRIRVIDNIGAQDNLRLQVSQCIDFIFEQEQVLVPIH
jgi:thymidylate kinase